MIYTELYLSFTTAIEMRALFLSFLIIAVPKFRFHSQGDLETLFWNTLVSSWFSRKSGKLSWSCFESKTEGLGLRPQHLILQAHFQ